MRTLVLAPARDGAVPYRPRAWGTGIVLNLYDGIPPRLNERVAVVLSFAWFVLAHGDVAVSCGTGRRESPRVPVGLQLHYYLYRLVESSSCHRRRRVYLGVVRANSAMPIGSYPTCARTSRC